MVIRLVTFFIGLVLNSSLYAQHTLVGTVLGDSNKVVSHTHIMLMNQKDSSLVRFTRSNEKGSFTLSATPNKPYFLKISHVGYITKNIAITSFNQPVLTLDTIRLKQMDTQLMEVVVKTAKAPLRMNGDTLEYDISQFKVPPGTDVEGLLRQLPGIKVDANGNVSAQGKQVEILVEGKKFFSGNTQMATKNLLADMLTVVQVYDTQTEFSRLTGLDDGNKTRKLNLKLKEIYKNMTFGQAYGGIGTAGRYESKLSLNRFTDKQQFSILGFSNNINQHSVGYGEYENFYGRRLTNIALFGPSTTDFLSYGLPNLLYTGGNSANGDTKSHGIGANYNRFGKKTKLTASYYQNKSNMNQESTEVSNYLLPEGSNYTVNNASIVNKIKGGLQFSTNIEHEINARSKVVLNTGINNEKNNDNVSKKEAYSSHRNELISDGSQAEDNSTRNTYLYMTSFYNHRLKKAGQSLSASATYKTNIGNNDIESRSSIMYLGALDSLSNTQQEIKTTQKNHNVTAGVLYGQNINSFMTLQSYANFGSSTLNSTFQSTNLLSTELIGDPSALATKFQINYSRVGSQVALFKKKFSATIGLSGQQFWLNGINQYAEFKHSNNTVNNQFRNISPHISANYSFGIFHTNASYTRTLNAPSFTEIQPFTFNNDPRNIIVGNPNLLGRLKDEYSLFFNGFLDKTNTQFYIGAQVSNSKRDIVQSKTVSDDLVTVYQFVNVEAGSSVLVYSGFSRPLVKKKLDIDLTYSVGKYNTFTPINNNLIKTNHWMHQPSVRFNWTPGKHLFISQGLDITSNVYHYTSEEDIPKQTMLQYIVNTNLSLRLPANIYFSGKLNVIANKSETTHFNQTIPIVNTSFSKNFLKSKNIALRISAHDLLNKRQDIYLYSYQNVVSVRRATILGRYYMATLIYNIKGVNLSLKNI